MKQYTYGLVVMLILGMAVSAHAREDEIRQEGKAEIEVKYKGDMSGGRRPDELKAKLDAAKETFKAKREEIKNLSEGEKKEMQEKRKAEVKNLQESWKKEVQSIKKERIAARREFVVTRFSNAVKALEANQVRVRAMIDKQIAAKTDVAQAEASYKASVDALAQAKISLEKLKTASATAETQAATLRTLAKETEAKLKESRDALMKAVRSLFPKLEVSGEVNTSASVTTQ